MKSLRILASLAAAIAATMSVACAGGGAPETAATPQDSAAVAAVQLDAVPAGRALLYVFNASGATLISNNYDVKANGRRIADLPRRSWSVAVMSPGSYRLEGAGRKLDITLAEGQRQYVVVAYHADRSWGFPVLGSPVTFSTVTDAQARLMITKFARRDAPVT